MCTGFRGPVLSNADLAPTLSERSPLSPGRRPGRLGRTMRGETSQAGNRARKTRRRSRRGEHAGELEGGPPEVPGVWDRHALLLGSLGSSPQPGASPGAPCTCPVFVCSPVSALPTRNLGSLVPLSRTNLLSRSFFPSASPLLPFSSLYYLSRPLILPSRSLPSLPLPSPPPSSTLLALFPLPLSPSPSLYPRSLHSSCLLPPRHFPLPRCSHVTSFSSLGVVSVPPRAEVPLPCQPLSPFKIRLS